MDKSIFVKQKKKIVAKVNKPKLDVQKKSILKNKMAFKKAQENAL